MSTLSEHKGDGNPIETSRQLEDTKGQIFGMLQHFDALPSRFDRFVFKYIYLYLIGLFFLYELCLLGFNSQLGRVLWGSGLSALYVVIIILVLWPFNIWRLSTPKTLRDLLEKKRIYIPNGNVNESYLHFLENYRDTLASPKRYFLSGFPMVVLGILSAYNTINYLFVEHLNSFLTILWVAGNLFSVLLLLGGVYCIGIATWAIYISGWYVRKLVRIFELRIQSLHTDKCGGLKVLGDFCFGLFSPILIGSVLTIGYILLSLISREVSGVYLVAINVVLPFLLLLLYALPAAIFAFILPLRDIHIKMVSEGEIDEDTYNARIEALREEIQLLFDTNQVEDAKVLQEKKAVLETLYTPYPTWPFRFRSKFISTFLGVCGSLFIGMITAALQQYFLPAILSLLFHKP